MVGRQISFNLYIAIIVIKVVLGLARLVTHSLLVRVVVIRLVTKGEIVRVAEEIL